MRSGEGQPPTRVVEYDHLSHRLWILGQRCHHGATGSVAALAGFGLIVRPAPGARPWARSVRSLALAVAGGALMVHDWKDRSIWFERGRGSQA